jgi:hypothetical protein
MKRITVLLLTALFLLATATNVRAAGPTACNYEYILPMEYDRVDLLDAYKLLQAWSAEKSALFDLNGNRVTDWYEFLADSGWGYFLALKDNTVFTLGPDGVETGFSAEKRIAGYGEGIIVTTDLDQSDGMPLRYYEGDYHVYNIDGTLLATFPHEGHASSLEYGVMSFHDGLYCYKDADGQCGAMDVHGNVVIQPQFESLEAFINGYAIASKNGKYGIIDKTGKPIVDFTYDSIEAWTDADPNNKNVVYITTLDGVQGIIETDDFSMTPLPDLSGYVIGLCYIEARMFLIQGRAASKYGLVSFDGKLILPVEYDRIGEPSEGSVMAEKGCDKCGYYDYDGNELTEFNYRIAMPFSQGLAYVLQAWENDDGTTSFSNAFIDKTGDMVIDLGPAADSARFSEGFAWVGDYYGKNHYIDLTGKTVMSPEAGAVWYQASDVSGGLAVVSSNLDADITGNTGVIRYNGAVPSDWAANDVKRAIELGLVPENLQKYYGSNMTREDFCTLTFALLKKTGTEMMTPTEEKPMVFEDTKSGTVYTLKQLGIIYGNSETQFAPARTVTREEAAVILARMADYLKIQVPQTPGFTYVDASAISDWAQTAVNDTYGLGVMTGLGTGSFSPKTGYTVQQAVVTMLRLYSVYEKAAE